jgi:NDP-sugar pyrophosphorylase family protein
MQAVILAGGKGTRLKPYTVTIPKPLVPVGEHPILEVILRQLKQQGFRRVTLAVGYHSELIQAYFLQGEKHGLTIEYSLEDTPLGTAGPLKLIQDLDDHFLVMNSDDLSDFDYASFLDYHKKNEAIVTIGMFSKEQKIDLGIIEADQSNVVKNYIEKPTYDFQVSMGIYAFNKEAVRYIPENKYYDFPDLIRTLLKKGKKVLAYPHPGFWLDIGRPEDYEVANEKFEEIKKKLGY